MMRFARPLYAGGDLNRRKAATIPYLPRVKPGNTCFTDYVLIRYKQRHCGADVLVEPEAVRLEGIDREVVGVGLVSGRGAGTAEPLAAVTIVDLDGTVWHTCFAGVLRELVYRCRNVERTPMPPATGAGCVRIVKDDQERFGSLRCTGPTEPGAFVVASSTEVVVDVSFGKIAGKGRAGEGEVGHRIELLAYSVK